ncbi:MAG: hypothetical protein J6W51_05160 [Fibrobacter sp.]|nr:hypothetical protein [Fibrobacter sp.]
MLKIALLLGYIFGNYTDSAIEIYNKSLSAESAFKIELVPILCRAVLRLLSLSRIYL